VPRPARLFLVHASLMLFVVLLIARAAQVQLFQRERWASVAQRQQTDTVAIPAPRGGIYDAEHAPLARNIEYVSIGIAPREVRDRTALAATLRELKLSRSLIRQATDPDRVWLHVPGLFPHDAVAELRGMRGVVLDPVYQRWYSSRPSTRRLVGRASPGGSGTDGLERALDEYLTGVPGAQVKVRDGVRRERGSPEFAAVPPRPGDDVVLTINQQWQEIAERALREAVDSTGAAGGDMVVLEPGTGAVRALAAVRRGRAVSGIPALTDPYEPGSTIKPLFASRLLLLGRVAPDDRVNVGNGQYTVHGRTISDVHRGDSLLTLTEVIVHSSNVGIAKFAERFTRPEQYETLRDFGFGTPTGVPYPSEASGTLYATARWTKQSDASLAIGYEVAVTALQMAAAYAAIANGGELLEPALVQEIRAPNGTSRYRHRKRVVRRVMPPAIAAQVMAMLRQTVEAGSATAAAPAGYAVAGKTGTARRIEGGRYDGHVASFAGIFPADDPEVVVIVRLDNPTGRYYGGQIAAPVFRAAIEAALAATGTAMDRTALASSGARADTAAAPFVVADAAVLEEGPDEIAPAPSARFDLPIALPPDTASPAARAVPDVRGRPLREAAHALHAAGFRVRIGGSGRVVTSAPAAGTVAAAGAVVRIVAEP
jgi:cell division protein FtsI (penicillin-binding protein 3)